MKRELDVFIMSLFLVLFCSWARSSVDVEPLDEETCVTEVLEATKQDDETMQSTSTLKSFSNVGPPRHLPPLGQTVRNKTLFSSLLACLLACLPT